MRESLERFQSLRLSIHERIGRQTSLWNEKSPHSQSDEEVFVERLRQVNELLQEINDSAAANFEEKQTLNRLVIENSKKRDEKLLDPLKGMNDICEQEINEEYPHRSQLYVKLEDAVVALEDFVAKF